MILHLLAGLLVFAGTLHAAAAGGESGFLEDKNGIAVLALERVRRNPDDAGRAVKAGENRLRRLHENYKLAKSTPPTSLDGDVRELTSAATRLRLARSRGRTPPADPRAEALIERHWRTYRDRVEALFEDVRYKRGGGASESAVYWEALKDFQALQEELLESLAYNPPPGERSAEEAAAKDRWSLLKRLEDPSRAAGRLTCVKAPEETARPAHFDVGPFYRAVGLLPGTNPLRTAAFELPAGCRTVTQREAAARLVFRASRGRGRIVIGKEEKPLTYDYVAVPPEVPYLIENDGREPLDVELAALAP